MTLLVAGVGWAAASAPAVLAAPGDTAAAPAVAVVLLGAAALGAGMGALLGAAQAWVLRGSVAHAHRWVAISTVAWTPTMTVIFTGATMPSASWSCPGVVGLGALTGLAAGTVSDSAVASSCPCSTGRGLDDFLPYPTCHASPDVGSATWWRGLRTTA